MWSFSRSGCTCDGGLWDPDSVEIELLSRLVESSSVDSLGDSGGVLSMLAAVQSGTRLSDPVQM